MTFLTISKISLFEFSNLTKIFKQYKVNSSESANIFTFSIVSASVSTFIIASIDKQNFITSIFLVVTSRELANSYKLLRFICFCS